MASQKIHQQKREDWQRTTFLYGCVTSKTEKDDSVFTDQPLQDNFSLSFQNIWEWIVITQWMHGKGRTRTWDMDTYILCIYIRFAIIFRETIKPTLWKENLKKEIDTQTM